MSRVRTITSGLIALALAATLVAAVGCGSDDEGPEDIAFDLEIKDGSLNLDQDVIKVSQGDNVTFRIKSDTHGSFHLHGYGLVEDVEPVATANMAFVANATGRFVIKLHLFEEGEGERKEGGKGEGEHTEEEAEITLTTLEVRPR